MDDDLLTALYHAASSEEPDTMDGPSLCDYYQRREETEQTRRALVDAVGDEVDVEAPRGTITYIVKKIEH